MSQRIHPDKAGSITAPLQALINEAKETLLDDPDKRRRYDLELKASEKNNNRKVRDPEAENLRRQVQEMRRRQQQYEVQLQQQHALSKRKEEDTRRKHQSQIQKYRRLSQQQIRRNEEELQKEKERYEAEKIVQFCCGICSKIVPSVDCWDADCCRRLFCGKCLISCGQISSCPYFRCQFPIQDPLPGSNSPAGWTHNNKFVQKQIEEVAPCCTGCGVNVLKRGFTDHKRVCVGVATNQICLKCNGNGSLRGPFGNLTIPCTVCSGNKTLCGEFTKCFMCSANTAKVFAASCDLCHGDKCVKGKWSPCFRCGCLGTVKVKQKGYQTTMGADMNGDPLIFHSITAMSEHADKSFEELRLESHVAGHVDVEQLVPCDVCLGEKKLEGDWIQCTICQAGRIRLLNGTEAPCTSCSGNGAVINGSVRVGNTRPCPFCSSNGCENCKFTGRITA